MGHLAVGIAAKRISRDTPIAALVIAPIVPDLAEVVLEIAGVEHSWWYTHTVPAGVAWAIVAGVIGLALYGRAGLILAALAATHVPLDYITSRIGVFPSGPTIGLGIYGQPAVDLAVEAVVICLGWWLYRQALAPDRRNHWAVFAIGAAMLVFQGVWTTIL
ncbi:MAG TPA: hypothetical protein VGO00_03495 [Kofleriaceae bacterium]|nr:hypothetical protein [Kofleriaceae bacterium]